MLSVLVAAFAVAALAALGFFGSQAPALRPVLGIAVPYGALAVFAGGLAWRVALWARSPVPFRIPTTCGQQRSLDGIRESRLESPFTGWGVAARVGLEVLLFRSLFRNTRFHLRPGPRFLFDDAKWLWGAALAFHWALLVVVLRHLRLFFEPTPRPVAWLVSADAMFELGVPAIYLSDIVLVLALAYLIGRRLASARLRYISLPADYFAIGLVLAIAVSGVTLRHLARPDVVAIKQFALGLAALRPVDAGALDPLFFAHLLLVSALAACFPFTKLVHAPGVLLSPTRNLPNNSRARRHVNPWNGPSEVRSYDAWEQEFADALAAAGLPVTGNGGNG